MTARWILDYLLLSLLSGLLVSEKGVSIFTGFDYKKNTGAAAAANLARLSQDLGFVVPYDIKIHVEE